MHELIGEVMTRMTPLPEIDVPFSYSDGPLGEYEREGQATVTIDEEDRTFEIVRISPDEIDDEDPKIQVRDWMGENYPEFTEI
jgi:hypothetical protein